MNNTILKMNQLICQVGAFRLGPVDFSLESGEYLMLTGPTGSGKTLFLELVAGLRQPSGGAIFLGGVNITGIPPEERFLGFAYQDSLLYPFLNVAENILFGAKARKKAKEPGIRERFDYLTDIMKIRHILSRYPRFLSGGEKQRVSLARALLMGPPLLLLDEPLSSLDPETKNTLRELLREIYQKEKVTVIHVTHDPTEVTCLGTRQLMLRNGKIDFEPKVNPTPIIPMDAGIIVS